MEYTKGECGCTTEEWEWVATGKHHKKTIIKYCPKHKAAPALYEACKAMRVFYETGDIDFQKVKVDVLSALAEAEGK